MIVLCLNMLALWGYSGAVRAKTKTTPNPEDVATVAKGSSVSLSDSPEIGRVLRAHRNATDNILPFALLAFLYVAYGASPMAMGIVCGIFTLARLCHTFVYLAGKQPWRTIFYTIGGVDTLVLMALIIRSMVCGLGHCHLT
jgi:uncharacterized MAPEG superfamily protein